MDLGKKIKIIEAEPCTEPLAVPATPITQPAVEPEPVGV